MEALTGPEEPRTCRITTRDERNPRQWTSLRSTLARVPTLSFALRQSRNLVRSFVRSAVFQGAPRGETRGVRFFGYIPPLGNEIRLT